MWRTRLSRAALGIAAVALLLTPTAARAQFLFFPFGGGNMYGYNYPGLLYARPVFPNMMRYSSPPPSAAPYVSPYAYNPLLYNAAFAPGSPGYASMVLPLPGYVASIPPRRRTTVEPALAVNPAAGGVRQADYDADAGDSRARIEVVVPTANAEVVMEGKTMGQSGKVREYFSPPLEAGSRYVYDVTVRWRDSEGEHSQTRRVRVSAGARERVDFTANK